MERPNRYKRPARINLTDKDARLMRTRQGIVPSYNAQAMVSPVATDEGVTGMLVTASDVVDEPNDTARLTEMTKQAEEVTGTRVPLTLADAGYFAGKTRGRITPKRPAGGNAGHGQADEPSVPQGPVHIR